MGRRLQVVIMRLLIIPVVVLAFLGAAPVQGKAAATAAGLGATNTSHPTVTAETTTPPAGAEAGTKAEAGAESPTAAGSSPVAVAAEAVTSAFLSAARVVSTVVKTARNLVSPTPAPKVSTIAPATTQTITLATVTPGDVNVATSMAVTTDEKKGTVATIEPAKAQTSPTMRLETENNSTIETVAKQSSATMTKDTDTHTTITEPESTGVKISATIPKESEKNSTVPKNVEPMSKTGDATLTGTQTMNETTVTHTTPKIETTPKTDAKAIPTAPPKTDTTTKTMVSEMRMEGQTLTSEISTRTNGKDANDTSSMKTVVTQQSVKKEVSTMSSTSLSDTSTVNSSESVESRDLLLDEEVNKTLHAITYAANSFASDLYEVARKKSGNLIISPLSANIILALTALGARENTAKQLVSALHLPPELNRVPEGYKSLLDNLHVTDDVILTIANKLYVQQFFPIKDSFKSIAENHFKSEIDNLDFTNKSDIARETINQWVEVHTEGVIRDLFEEGTPSKDTYLVLVNTVYLKAGWEKPFEEDLTKNGTFYLTRDSKITVPMMRKPFSELPYCDFHDLEAKFLVLPFEDEIDNESDEAVLRMIIILPNSVDGLQELEGKIKSFNISSVDFESREVNLTLPKFKMEAKHDFKQTLEMLGVTDLFSRKANLSGIVGDAQIYVNKVIQKTSIDVNENGTEIATATGNEFMFYSSPPPRADFIVDHPFLFCIMHRDLILFMGRVLDPRT